VTAAFSGRALRILSAMAKKKKLTRSAACLQQDAGGGRVGGQGSQGEGQGEDAHFYCCGAVDGGAD
jgi:hypothetical protein